MQWRVSLIVPTYKFGRAVIAGQANSRGNHRSKPRVEFQLLPTVQEFHMQSAPAITA